MDFSDSSSDFFDSISEIIDNGSEDNRNKILKIFKELRNFYKVLLSNEHRHFSTTLAGIRFLNDKYELESKLDENLFSLTRLHKQLKSNSKLVASIDEYHFTIKNAILIVQSITNCTLPYQLIQFTKNIPDIHIKNRFRTENKRIDIYRAIVRDNPFYKKKIDAIYIEIICSHEDYEDFILKIGYPYLENANMIFTGMCINLLSAEIIRTDPYTFSIHSPGIIIFEPDYLIDAVDLAENYGLNEGYKIYFLKRYFSKSVSYPMVFGNLINSLFDEILLKPDIEFEKARQDAFKSKPISIFALYSRDELDDVKLREELSVYFSKIQDIVENILKVNYSDAVYSVEPSFLSPIYGIQGRLDLLVEYSDDPLRKDVVELKSGNSPNFAYSIKLGDNQVPIGVWVNHLAQVIAYNLLLDSTFANRKGNSSILYVKSSDKPLRDVANFHFVIEKMILLRNNIILLENAVMNGSYKLFNKISNLLNYQSPSYITDSIKSFLFNFQSLDDTEKAYLMEFTSFILRESYTIKTGISFKEGNSGFSSLWIDSLEDKIEKNSVLVNLKFNQSESDIQKLHIVFDFNQTDIYTSFRKGDIGILFPYKDGVDDNKISNQIIKCSIKSISSEKLTVSLRNKLVNSSIFEFDSLWRLEPDTLDSIDKITYSTIFNFLTCNQNKKNLIFGKAEPQFSETIFEKISELNDNQNELINRAVNAKDYYLIQGPPGTGKTNKILNNIVKKLLESSEGNILVTAYTNRAVDEIASALDNIDETSNYIRIGSKYVSENNEKHLPLIIENKGMHETYNMLKSTRIIISTVASVLSNQEIFDIKKFDTLIVDEASQILESQLIGLIAKCGRFILIGDEKQLPPVVVQNDESKICNNTLLNQIGILNFADSLFERLIRICKSNNWTNAYGQLYYQARMHYVIQDYPNKFFYNNSLQPIYNHQTDDITEYNINSENKIERILASGRMIFIDCPKDKGKVNQIQAEICLKFIDFISSKHTLNPDLIGVISPFRMQCFEIYKRLDFVKKKIISVDTVERYQGSQRNIIILSMALSNQDMLKRAISIDVNGLVDRKLNVAITRAKSHFILLGNSDILSYSNHYSNLIKFIENNNGSYSFLPLLQID